MTPSKSFLTQYLEHMLRYDEGLTLTRHEVSVFVSLLFCVHGCRGGIKQDADRRVVCCVFLIYNLLVPVITATFPVFSSSGKTKLIQSNQFYFNKMKMKN